MSEITNVLDTVEEKANEIVIISETLKGFEHDEESYKEEYDDVKKKFDDGIISKGSFDSIISKNREKITQLKQQKKESWDQLISLLNSVTDLLAKIKDHY